MKFALRDLCQRLYAEFPPPPGDYEISPPPGEIPLSVKSYVRYDFPNNREDFQIWTKRFDQFFQGVYKVYYSIRSMISTLRKVHRESVEQTETLIEELRKKNGFSWHIDSLKESRKYSIAEINYYDQVFQSIGKMKHKIHQIKDKISTYDNYFYRGKWKTVFSLISWALTGVFIPFFFLFSQPDWSPRVLGVMKLISGLGFGLSTVFVVFLVYRDISKF